MVRSYRKGEAVKLSPNFGLHEFDCHCQRASCQTTLVDMELIKSLEEARKTLHLIHIDCGYRCEPHNLEVGGVPNSQHCLGKAADIKAPVLPSEVHKCVEQVPGFANGGIGLYPHFVHVDVRGHKARWTSAALSEKKNC